jgi:hypothetical protein
MLLAAAYDAAYIKIEQTTRKDRITKDSRATGGKET